MSGGIDGGGEAEGGASLENITTVYTPILSENTPSFNHTATSSKKVAVQGNEYKAPLYSKPDDFSSGETIPKKAELSYIKIERAKIK